MVVALSLQDPREAIVCTYRFHGYLQGDAPARFHIVSFGYVGKKSKYFGCYLTLRLDSASVIPSPGASSFQALANSFNRHLSALTSGWYQQQPSILRIIWCHQSPSHHLVILLDLNGQLSSHISHAMDHAHNEQENSSVFRCQRTLFHHLVVRVIGQLF